MANIFSKIKGIFYDEVEVDGSEQELANISKIVKKDEKPKIEEIKIEKEEIIKEEKPLPRREEEKPEIKVENTFNERELFRSERTFNFTEFDDEEVLPPRKNVLTQETRNSRVEKAVVQEPVQPKKAFKPSPIISPIYGILDKDYKKEEIKTRTVVSSPVTSSVTTYDSIRRKAYGTLEDELEDTITKTDTITTQIVTEEIKEIDRDIQELEDKASKIEDLINKIEDATNTFDKEMSIGDIEDKIKLPNFDDEDDDIGVSDKTMTDSTLEHDLFNLIDSMYDDKED